MNKQVKIFIAIVALLILGIVAAVMFQTKSVPAGPGKYDAFATCLKDKGATFYGAFWCPHCQAQEKALEASRQTLEKIGLYVECSTADATGQLQVCTDKGIKSYPTWELADGTIIPDDSPDGAGVKLETLAAKTGCVLPQ